MSWSLNIGKVAGTIVRLHITCVLFLAWIFASSYASDGVAAARDTLLFVVLLFLCVLRHEFGHIFTARAFGVPTPYVMLLPIGGVAQLERIPEEPWEEFLIAIAGPTVNVVIAAALIVFAHAHLGASAAMGINDMQVPMVDRLATVNLFLALFNLIPAFPMDGGRVLRSALANRMGFVRALRTVKGPFQVNLSRKGGPVNVSLPHDPGNTAKVSPVPGPDIVMPPRMW